LLRDADREPEGADATIRVATKWDVCHKGMHLQSAPFVVGMARLFFVVEIVLGSQ